SAASLHDSHAQNGLASRVKQRTVGAPSRRISIIAILAKERSPRRNVAAADDKAELPRWPFPVAAGTGALQCGARSLRQRSWREGRGHALLTARAPPAMARIVMNTYMVRYPLG